MDLDPASLIVGGLAALPSVVGETATAGGALLVTAIALAAAVAPYMKPPKEDQGGLYPWLYVVVNFFAQNFRHAKNARPTGLRK